MSKSQKKPSISGKGCLPMGLAVLVFFVILFAGYLGLAYILRKANNFVVNTPGDSKVQQATNPDNKTAVTGKIDALLVGNWDTGCLVPDADSPWAERHTFTLSSNGIGNHKRYSGETCAGMAVDHDDNLNWVVSEKGKINLAFTSGISSGTTLYDIYDISGEALRFGHGFCNCTTTGGAFGTSEGDRMVRLNNFLLYKKQ